MPYFFSSVPAGDGASSAANALSPTSSSQPSPMPHTFSVDRRPVAQSLRSIVRSNRDQDSHFIPVSYVSQTGSAITKIEAILESVAASLLSGTRELSLPFSSRPLRHKRRQREESATARDDPRKISYPGKNQAEAKKFTAILKILQLSHAALISGNVISKRNVYYQNRELFRDQSVVNRLVDDLAYSLGFGRDALNIVADGRGILSGHLRLIHWDGSITACNCANENGIFVPPLRNLRYVDISSCRWMLVVEKEATFRTLAAAQYWNKSIAGPGVLFTGKGYPDLAVRSFLNLVHYHRLLMPIYALVDYDPYGFQIYRTYKYGSRSLDHEDNTTVPGIRWLGIRSDDLMDFESESRSVDGSQDSDSQQSLGQSRYIHDHVAPLSLRDRKTAAKTLEAVWNQTNHDLDQEDQARELQVMLMLNMKAEIQAVDNYGDLASWLDRKLCQ